MPYEAIRELDGGWAVLRDRDASAYRVTRDGETFLEVGAAGAWHRVMHQATRQDWETAAYLRGVMREPEEAMRVLLAHAVETRDHAAREGLRAGMERARREAEIAASPAFERLKAAAQDMTGCLPVGVDGCPWLAGVTRAVGRRAQKMVFVYPWNVDHLAHREIVEGARKLGLPMTGQQDATGNRKAHALVLAPTATYGAGPTTGFDLRQDDYGAALRLSGLRVDQEGRLVDRAPPAAGGEAPDGPAPR